MYRLGANFLTTIKPTNLNMKRSHIIAMIAENYEMKSAISAMQNDLENSILHGQKLHQELEQTKRFIKKQKTFVDNANLQIDKLAAENEKLQLQLENLQKPCEVKEKPKNIVLDFKKFILEKGFFLCNSCNSYHYKNNKGFTIKFIQDGKISVSGGKVSYNCCYVPTTLKLAAEFLKHVFNL